MLAKLILSKVLDTEDQKAVVEKRIRNSDQTIEKRKLVIKQSISVILCGRLENPVLTCPKAIKCCPGLRSSSMGARNAAAAASDEAPTVIPIVAKLGLEV